MVKIQTNDAGIDEKEVTAYIQQQMIDLAPHLEEKSALQVKLKKKAEGFQVELTAILNQGEIQTVGWNENIYDAIRNAKDGLLDYFVLVQDELNPREREEKLNHLSQNSNLYLH